MRIFAIDPGSSLSGYVLFADGKVIESGVLENNILIDKLNSLQNVDKLAVEMIASYGMAVGKDVFETCVWIGRFLERWSQSKSLPSERIYRKDVKIYLCGSLKAKDSNIRQALIDLLGKPGTKKQPGPTFGVSSHAWAALAVAVTCLGLDNEAKKEAQ